MKKNMKYIAKLSLFVLTAMLTVSGSKIAAFATDEVIKPDYAYGTYQDNLWDESELTKEDYEDPEMWKYMGGIDEGKYNLDEMVSTMSVPYEPNIESPFTGKTISHNSKFSKCDIYYGVDVSKWQKDIDWNKAKKDGVDFAIIRAAYRSLSSSGSLNTDPYFQQNIVNAKEAGIEHVGIYIFSQAINEKEAVEEAKYAIKLVKDYKINLPIVMDVEYAYDSRGHIGRFDTSISKDELTKICEAFCERVKKEGYTPMIYASKSFMENKFDGEALGKKYDMWLAHYTNKTGYEGDYSFWQYSSTGSVDGIPGNVDCNVWYRGDKPVTKIKLSASSKTLTAGSSFRLSKSVTPSDTTDKLSWSSSNPEVAYVNNSGKVVAVTKGKTTITLKSSSGESATCTVTVNEKMSGFKVIVSDATYTGKNIKKTVKVQSKAKVAKLGVVTTALNMRKGPSTDYGKITTLDVGSEVTIMGTVKNGDKTWYAVKYVDDKANKYYGYISGGKTGHDYEKVTMGYRKPSLGSHYTVAYSNNKKAGQAKVVVTGVGKGTYTGNINGTFIIKPATVTGVKKVTAKKSYVTIKWTKNVNGSQYRIYRADSKNGTYKRVGVVAYNKFSFKDTSVKAGKTYYYIVKACKRDGNIYYLSAKSQEVKVTTPKPLTKKGVVKATSLNVRKGAGTGYSIIGSLKNKSQVTIYSKKNGWYYIQAKINGSTKKGYVKATYIKIK